MKAYSEAQRAMAVEILNRHDGKLSRVATDEIRAILDAPDLPKSTIWRWLQKEANGKKNASPEAKAAAAEALDAIFEKVARTYATHALEKDVIKDANATQSMIAAGTAVDKMRLLRGLPTEIVQIMPELLETIRRKGYDPLKAINAMHTQFSALPDAPMMTPTHGAN